MAKVNKKTTFDYKKLLKSNVNLMSELDKYSNILDKIDKIAKIAIQDDEAKIELQVYLKVTPTITEDDTSVKSSNMLDIIKDAESPEAFLEALNSAKENKKVEPKYYDLNIDELDNSTFLAILEKMIVNYKQLSEQLITKIKSVL
tara:strand:- start:4349 stop:4783 length:435 start_codon:yes stop_codon:yes gene_type:complete